MSGAEREFVSHRLRIVAAELNRPTRLDVDGTRRTVDRDPDGVERFRVEVTARQELALVREARILEKLTQEVPEGAISRALLSWRKLLGMRLAAHNGKYAKMQEAYDAWMQLPFPIRIDVPEPPQPPECEVVDRHGNSWVVDYLLLNVFDDLVRRIERWASAAD